MARRLMMRELSEAAEALGAKQGATGRFFLCAQSTWAGVSMEGLETGRGKNCKNWKYSKKWKNMNFVEIKGV